MRAATRVTSSCSESRAPVSEVSAARSGLSVAKMPFALRSLTVLVEPGSLARPCFVLQRWSSGGSLQSAVRGGSSCSRTSPFVSSGPWRVPVHRKHSVPNGGVRRRLRTRLGRRSPSRARPGRTGPELNVQNWREAGEVALRRAQLTRNIAELHHNDRSDRGCDECDDGFNVTDRGMMAGERSRRRRPFVHHGGRRHGSPGGDSVERASVLPMLSQRGESHVRRPAVLRVLRARATCARGGRRVLALHAAECAAFGVLPRARLRVRRLTDTPARGRPIGTRAQNCWAAAAASDAGAAHRSARPGACSSSWRR